MPILSLTIIESEDEAIQGIPEYVEFTTNTPSTVFYTFDGSTPDDSSAIAVGKVSLPTTGRAFVLKAIAISGNLESDILSIEYKTVQNSRTARDGAEGISIYPYGETPVESLSVDAVGQPTRESVIEFQDLEMKASTSTRIGEKISGDSTLDFVNFQDKNLGEEQTLVTSANSAMFDPKAKVIFINGQITFQDDSMRIYNRPHNTMEPTSKFYTENQNILDQSSLVTGNFVRYMINPKTNKIVFYYHESRENRWIVSEQELEGDPGIRYELNQGGPGAGKFVIKWVEDRAMSRIY